MLKLLLFLFDPNFRRFYLYKRKGPDDKINHAEDVTAIVKNENGTTIIKGKKRTRRKRWIF